MNLSNYIFYGPGNSVIVIRFQNHFLDVSFDLDLSLGADENKIVREMRLAMQCNGVWIISEISKSPNWPTKWFTHVCTPPIIVCSFECRKILLLLFVIPLTSHDFRFLACTVLTFTDIFPLSNNIN